MPTYTKTQIAEKLKIRKRTVTHYADEGLVIPSNPDIVKGRAREWDDQSQIEFGTVQELVDIGVDLKTIKVIMDEMRAKYPKVLRGTDDSIKDVVCMDWRTVTGETERRFFPIRQDDDVIKIMAHNPKNPKTFVRVIYMSVIRAAAVRRLKG
jgi:DNA-binding transcriptional MerR regulator